MYGKRFEKETFKTAVKDNVKTPVSYTHLDVYKRQVLFSSGYFYALI